jgi:hypothetical protein
MRSLLLQHSPCIRQAYTYSTIPKKAAGRFTSNKLIAESAKASYNEVQRTLVYIGKMQNSVIKERERELY